MYKPLAILGFLFCVEFLDAEPSPEAERNPFKLIDSADVVIYYSPENDDRMMEISVGPRKDLNKPREVIRKEKFSPTSKDLAKFFHEQPRKDLIVIIFEKNVLEDAQRMAIAKEFRSYFLARGYKRILIQQATSGGRFPVYIDHKAEQPGPAQPATQPADKAPAKDQPSTPASKEAPR